MKLLARILLLSIFLMMYQTSEAQFFKKLGDKISEAAENTIIKKSADKTADEVSKGMDGIFSGMEGKVGGADVASPANSYHFDYRYKMKMTAEETTMKMDYFFKPDSDYAGMAMNQKGMKMFMIFDYDKEAAYSFISATSGKMYTTISLDLSTDNDWANDNYHKSDYTVTNLPSKTILGYVCKGKQIENSEWKFTMYYTDEVGISFQNILNASKQRNNPSVLSKYFKDAENGLMLYMKSVDKKHKEYKSVVMECVALDKEKRDFSTTDYNKMGF
jgi:hypothetical protein